MPRVQICLGLNIAQMKSAMSYLNKLHYYYYYNCKSDFTAGWTILFLLDANLIIDYYFMLLVL